MLSILSWSSLSANEQKQRLKRATQKNTSKEIVTRIITNVKERGDKALMQYSREFDGVDLSELRISKKCVAQTEISKTAFSAIKSAIATITTFHKAVMPQTIRIDTAIGVSVERLYRPVDKVGLYIPGGNNTPLISSLLMQAIPALVAGCPTRVLCTPPDSRGEIDPHLLVAARLCQIETIYPIGGAQAIAAMAYGTESVIKVDKIFGPGNAYVTEAKVQVSIDPEGAAIDMPAGPSEVLIIADKHANPNYIAADLLAQAEHGIDSQVILLCETKAFADLVNNAIAEQIQQLKRAAIISQSLQHSSILVCSSRAEMVTIVNRYAPERLIINCVDATDWVDDIGNAGTIFLGPYAAETMGDYVTGSNHVLPTNGYARTHSGLSTNDFLKAVSVQSVTKDGIKTLGRAAYTLAMMEGLDAHANAVKLRLHSLGESNECT
jgi:histidinol dehydrogenase